MPPVLTFGDLRCNGVLGMSVSVFVKIISCIYMQGIHADLAKWAKVLPFWVNIESDSRFYAVRLEFYSRTEMD